MPCLEFYQLRWLECERQVFEEGMTKFKVVKEVGLLAQVVDGSDSVRNTNNTSKQKSSANNHKVPKKGEELNLVVAVVEQLFLAMSCPNC